MSLIALVIAIGIVAVFWVAFNYYVYLQQFPSDKVTQEMTVPRRQRRPRLNPARRRRRSSAHQNRG